MAELTAQLRDRLLALLSFEHGASCAPKREL
jgi:hypothetical protein